MFLKSCCCGCTLKKGTLIIGYLSFVISLLVFIYLIVAAATTSENNKNYGAAIIQIREGDHRIRFVQEDPSSEVNAFLVVGFIIVIARIIICVLLIIGANKGRRKLLLPWVIWDIICVIVLIISFFLPGKTHKNSSDDHPAVIISKVIGSVLEVYFILVVMSHYEELGRSKSNKAPTTA